MGDQVDPAAHLEGPNWLIVLVLDPGCCSDQIVEGRVAMEWGACQVGADLALGAQDIVSGSDRAIITPTVIPQTQMRVTA